MCKYNVPGHAHPGLLPSATPLTVSPPLTDPQCFGGAGGLRSPVYRKLKAFLLDVENEYDNFCNREAIEACGHIYTPLNFTMS
ncbi:Ankyrin repeat domain-containing protein 50 [Phytophthora cinnamomi]|uniref:Ankyrin repeat domain-containing protein 50 n=1 Tax=Phytophthora cinnamomi TaxID=4785 RepID=UPI00355ACAD4|nr:Ankyrin repeat domain-containing protein 50 [Phytophthora cinnamomi]